MPARITSLVFSAALVLAATPSAASAALPRPKTTRIVPLVSLAGIKLGMTPRQVAGQWRVAGVCSGSSERVCSWNSVPYESARVRYRAGKVVSVGIGGQTETCKINPFTFTVLRTWRTANGLELLAASATVRAKLPGVSGNGSEANPFQLRKRSGGRTVRFALFTGALTAGGSFGCPPSGPPPPDPFRSNLTGITLAYFP